MIKEIMDSKRKWNLFSTEFTQLKSVVEVNSRFGMETVTEEMDKRTFKSPQLEKLRKEIVSLPKDDKYNANELLDALEKIGASLRIYFDLQAD